MLLSFEGLKEFNIVGPKAEKLGGLTDCYFDDYWGAIRYLNVHLSWNGDFLLSPLLLQEVILSKNEILTRCSKDEVKQCPSSENRYPISKYYEEQQSQYFHLPHYWLGESTWGDVHNADEFFKKSRKRAKKEVLKEVGHSYHLRSANEVINYKAWSSNERVGNLSDLIIEIGTWKIRYLVVNTTEGSLGNKIILGYDWDIKFDWEKQSIYLSVDKQEILNAPTYDSSKPINREIEVQLYDYYGRPYWWK